ncbi:hypothetical protein NM688_g8752 [Phlebia brevispora]|uniref:Uncharacterized protein n=1 Tax=Phlebia brevispora TaxID=194682 RepID=A0ACC1RNC3_9APHY|nr:hypothetical protein NM688_g8752 [Phlebia brevispora]
MSNLSSGNLRFGDLRECVKCGKSKDDGATLLRCKACKVDLYCGQHCQRADWSLHRPKCRSNQQARQWFERRPEAFEELATLRRWAKFHNPTLWHLAVQTATQDPNAAEHTVFVVAVRARPNETNPRRTFKVRKARPYPIDAIPNNMAAQIRSVYESERASSSNQQHKMYMLCILPESPLPPFLIPSFFKTAEEPHYRPPEDLIKAINQGKHV